MLEWTRKLAETPSLHAMADLGSAAALLKELPLNDPGKALAECAAWLESIELEPTFGADHQMELVALIDQAGRASANELLLSYIGARPGTAGRMQDWRTLMDYLERLSSAYALGAADLADRGQAVRARMPVVLSRMMRAITDKMKIGWMRYLPPDRACWESLADGYRVAAKHQMSATMIKAYPGDATLTCAAHEFTVAVMLAAASPQGLPPRQIELVSRIGAAQRAAFELSSVRDAEWRHYLFDLDQPGPPARIPEQLTLGDGLLFFSAGAVLPRLAALVEETHQQDARALRDHFGDDFGASEKIWALEHLRRFWGDNPPSRQAERRAVNTSIRVAVGVPAIQRALDDSALAGASGEPSLLLDGTAEQEAASLKGQAAVAPNPWLLTDFSARGIGARCPRRPDGWLRVGNLIGFKLERSEKWCVAIVRRLRTDTRNQVDVGAEILGKPAALVTLEWLASTGSVGAGTGVLRSGAVLLSNDAHTDECPSLLFEPGTYRPGLTFALHGDGWPRRLKLRNAAETLDGWDRVEFDWID